MANDKAQETCFTTAVFAVGAIGGVALDIVTIYFSGFSASATQSGWLTLGIVFRVAVFMALAGFLACLFSQGSYRTAFAIGVAAPSVIINLGASVQIPKPREVPAVTIPNIPAPTPSSGSRGSSIIVAALGVSVAEAQTPPARPSEPGIGQVRVAISGAQNLDEASVAIVDRRTGRTLAVTRVSSETFDFAFAAGQYDLVLRGPHVTASPVPVTIDAGRRVVIDIRARTTEAKTENSSGLADFLKGANQRFEKAGNVKQQTGAAK